MLTKYGSLKLTYALNNVFIVKFNTLYLYNDLKSSRSSNTVYVT